MRSQGPTASVHVVIPNRNGRPHLSYSLESLARTTYPHYQVVLVDDGSGDDSVEYVRRQCPGAQILENGVNRGFAFSVNRGIEYALEKGADFVAVCNTDIRVLPNWLELALPVFAEDARLGLVGFQEVPRDRLSEFLQARVAPEAVRYADVARLPGCLYLCPAAVFRHIGLYDVDYFMYGEDNDLFCRLRQAGYRLAQTNIPVWHHGEGASGNRPLTATWLSYRNALRCALKNESLWGIARMWLSLLNQGCNIFLPRVPGDPEHRMRRCGALTNLLLLFASGGWNLVHLVPTLKARRLAKRRAADFRKGRPVISGGFV